jgi:galactokinase
MSNPSAPPQSREPALPGKAMGGAELLLLDPVPKLLSRVRAELAADFLPNRPIRISRAPGRLDVMGGIADYTGSLVCEAILDRAAAVALQRRDDRNVQVFSFNLFDEHRPFTFRIPLDALADHSVDQLRSEFNQPGRRWAGYLAGCLAILHHHHRIDLADPGLRGMNLALLSTVPLGAGVSSSAAIEVAAMINFMDELNLRGNDPMALASMCQEVENRVVGAPCGIMDQVSSCVGEEGKLMRLICQPHELQPSLNLPPGIRTIGINSNVKHNIGGGMYGRTRCAAFMGHRIILEKMREMGQAADRPMQSDPMRGYLANLNADDYKKLFRPFLPEEIEGKTFLDKFGATYDTETRVDPDQVYHVVKATDHHVLEALRVKNFAGHLESATALQAGSPQRKLALDKAGHLMYASHLSYTNDALLGAPECDLLVKLVRQRESAGLYGAKITGGGSGGTVAVLANEGTDAALSEIMTEYEKQTGRKPEAFLGSSPGAWAMGTVVLNSI